MNEQSSIEQQPSITSEQSNEKQAKIDEFLDSHYVSMGYLNPPGEDNEADTTLPTRKELENFVIRVADKKHPPIPVNIIHTTTDSKNRPAEPCGVLLDAWIKDDGRLCGQILLLNNEMGKNARNLILDTKVPMRGFSLGYDVFFDGDPAKGGVAQESKFTEVSICYIGDREGTTMNHVRKLKDVVEEGIQAIREKQKQNKDQINFTTTKYPPLRHNRKPIYKYGVTAAKNNICFIKDHSKNKNISTKHNSLTNNHYYLINQQPNNNMAYMYRDFKEIGPRSANNPIIRNEDEKLRGWSHVSIPVYRDVVKGVVENYVNGLNSNTQYVARATAASETPVYTQQSQQTQQSSNSGMQQQSSQPEVQPVEIEQIQIENELKGIMEKLDRSAVTDPAVVEAIKMFDKAFGVDDNALPEYNPNTVPVQSIIPKQPELLNSQDMADKAAPEYREQTFAMAENENKRRLQEHENLRKNIERQQLDMQARLREVLPIWATNARDSGNPLTSENIASVMTSFNESSVGPTEAREGFIKIMSATASKQKEFNSAKTMAATALETLYRQSAGHRQLSTKLADQNQKLYEENQRLRKAIPFGRGGETVTATASYDQSNKRFASASTNASTPIAQSMPIPQMKFEMPRTKIGQVALAASIAVDGGNVPDLSFHHTVANTYDYLHENFAHKNIEAATWEDDFPFLKQTFNEVYGRPWGKNNGKSQPFIRGR